MQVWVPMVDLKLSGIVDDIVTQIFIWWAHSCLTSNCAESMLNLVLCLCMSARQCCMVWVAGLASSKETSNCLLMT